MLLIRSVLMFVYLHLEIVWPAVRLRYQEMFTPLGHSLCHWYIRLRQQRLEWKSYQLLMEIPKILSMSAYKSTSYVCKQIKYVLGNLVCLVFLFITKCVDVSMLNYYNTRTYLLLFTVVVHILYLQFEYRVFFKKCSFKYASV